MTRITSALCLAAAFGLATTASASPTNNYVIERSIDDGASWAPRGTIVVTGSTINTAKAKFIEASPSSSASASEEGQQVPLSAEDRKALINADRIFYRVKEAASSGSGSGSSSSASSSSSATTDDGEIARIVTTPCTLIRGFNIKSTKEVELTESLNVVITKTADGTGNAVTGLQLMPRTNLHHAKMSGASGDTCDKEVLGLFPSLTVSTTVGVSRTTVAKRTPKFEESLYFAGLNTADGTANGDAAAAAAPSSAQQEQKDPNQKYNEEGKPIDENGKVIPEPDNRSFFEKYWHYMLMFVVWNLLQNFINPPKKEGQAAAGGAAPAAA